MYAISLTLTLSGCATSNSALNRTLPPPPEFARPVDVAQPKRGEHAVAVAARERAGRIQANHVIDSTVDWYNQVRRSYGENSGGR